MSFAADTLAAEHPMLYHSYNLVFTTILYVLVFILLPIIGGCLLWATQNHYH